MNVLIEDSIYRADLRPMHRHSIKNFVLTRFNLRMPGYAARIARDDSQFRDWLAHRKSVFLSRCLKSVINQTSQPFKWFLLLDKSNHYDVVADTIERIERDYSFITPVFISNHKNMHQGILEAVNASIPKSDTYITLTRLDNDDALAKFFFSSLNEYLQYVDLTQHSDDFPLWLLFNFGAQYNDAGFAPFMQNNNAFASTAMSVTMREGPARISNARAHPLASNHTKVFRLGYPTRIIHTRLPVWLQCVHGQNVSNRARGSSLSFAGASAETISSWFSMDSKDAALNASPTGFLRRSSPTCG